MNDIYIKDISLIPNIMPVEGIVTNGVNLKSNPPHNGLDIAAKFNSNVYSAQRGLIIFADKLDKLNQILSLDKSKFRNELKEKVRNEIRDGLNKDKILNEEDKILLYKLYKKLRSEFKEIEN